MNQKYNDCVEKVIKKLQNYQGAGAKKIETLANYLIRFRSLCPD